jgi:hypothetical protein
VLVVLVKHRVVLLEMLVRIAHGQMLRQALNLPQKAVVVVDMTILLQLMVVQALVLVIIQVMHLMKFNLLNQAIVEHTDLDLMVAQVMGIMCLLMLLVVEAVLVL